eukprot:3188797-Pleurochrysis_carterae.AAC.1
MVYGPKGLPIPSVPRKNERFASNPTVLQALSGNTLPSRTALAAVAVTAGAAAAAAHFVNRAKETPQPGAASANERASAATDSIDAKR